MFNRWSRMIMLAKIMKDKKPKDDNSARDDFQEAMREFEKTEANINNRKVTDDKNGQFTTAD